MWGEAGVGEAHKLRDLNSPCTPSAIWVCGDFRGNSEMNALACGNVAVIEYTLKGSPGTQKESDKVCSRPQL